MSINKMFEQLHWQLYDNGSYIASTNGKERSTSVDYRLKKLSLKTITVIKNNFNE